MRQRSPQAARARRGASATSGSAAWRAQERLLQRLRRCAARARRTRGTAGLRRRRRMRRSRRPSASRSANRSSRLGRLHAWRARTSRGSQRQVLVERRARAAAKSSSNTQRMVNTVGPASTRSAADRDLAHLAAGRGRALEDDARPRRAPASSSAAARPPMPAPTTTTALAGMHRRPFQSCVDVSDECHVSTLHDNCKCYNRSDTRGGARMDAMPRRDRAVPWTSSASAAAWEAPDGPPRLAAAMRYAVFPGGARIRPRLCLAVAGACGDDDPDRGRRGRRGDRAAALRLAGPRRPALLRRRADAARQAVGASRLRRARSRCWPATR